MAYSLEGPEVTTFSYFRDQAIKAFVAVGMVILRIAMYMGPLQQMNHGVKFRYQLATTPNIQMRKPQKQVQHLLPGRPIQVALT